jgi:CcmD family protein
MKNLGYLIAAYVVIWVAVFAYIITLGRKIRQVAKDVQLLQKRQNQD